MVCIYCAGSTQVVNSRPQKRLGQTWRRRRCKRCGAVFTTIEVVDLSTSLVVLTDRGKRVPFSRDRLYLSIARACGHRANAAEDAAALTATIIASLRRGGTETAEIAATELIRTTAAVLQRFDPAAGVQYTAYHHR